MKTERAIELLNRISDSQFDGPHGDERREALEMAVRALEQNLVQESDDLVHDLVKDCISRKMAIEYLMTNMCWYDEDGYESDDDYKRECITDLINGVPSAQPEIIRCKDCKYMIDTGDDLMCDNAKGWVVATASDFGCVLAERRTDG